MERFAGCFPRPAEPHAEAPRGARAQGRVMASPVQTESAQRVSGCLNALLREQPIFARAPAPSRSQPRDRYLGARDLYITADADGSNGHLSRAWKHELQPFAGETGVCVHVNHFPPGTSKWNKIEHRLFCHLPQNW